MSSNRSADRRLPLLQRPINRRALLGASLLGLGVGAALPDLLRVATRALAAENDGASAPGRRLVVVELSGGNDGLNTVVPYGDDAYYRQRPKIGIAAAGLRKIDDHFGFHPSLAGFERLYKDGEFAVIHGCGYDRPSLSHFAAMGFWHSGVPNGGDALGWLGRAADQSSPEARASYLVNIATQQSLAVQSGVHAPLVFDEPERFQRAASYQQVSLLESLNRQDRDSRSNPALAYVADLAANASDSAGLIRDAWADYRTPVDYGLDFGLARDLRKVAALIEAGFPTKFYYVSYRGNAFDTHVYQQDVHARILTYTADAIRGFLDDVKRQGRAEEVALMVFTEFGRRVPENASLGTDHGTATPMFVAGLPVKRGLYGAAPSLTELDDGNLIHTSDFRRVYASLLGEWLGLTDTASVLKGDFLPLGLFG